MERSFGVLPRIVQKGLSFFGLGVSCLGGEAAGRLPSEDS